MDSTFQVGEQYENRKGVYGVLWIDGDEMRIRWDTGEITTRVGLHEVIRQEDRNAMSIAELFPFLSQYHSISLLARATQQV